MGGLTQKLVDRRIREYEQYVYDGIYWIHYLSYKEREEIKGGTDERSGAWWVLDYSKDEEERFEALMNLCRVYWSDSLEVYLERSTWKTIKRKHPDFPSFILFFSNTKMNDFLKDSMWMLRYKDYQSSIDRVVQWAMQHPCDPSSVTLKIMNTHYVSRSKFSSSTNPPRPKNKTIIPYVNSTVQGREYEELIRDTLNKHKWNVELTPIGADGGVDGYGTDDNGKSVLIQAKCRYSNAVRIADIYPFSHAILKHKPDRAILIMRSVMTDQARKAAEDVGIEIWENWDGQFN